MALALLVVGYAMAIPFTVWIPGFRRLWRRRELWVFAVAQTGAVLIALGHGLRGNEGGVLANGGWALGLTVAYVLEGRKRLSSARQ